MIGTIIFNIFIEPLKLLFELVFSVTYRLFDSPLLVLIAMSVVVNLVALPLYNRADAIQQEENERQAKMAHWVEHIKKTFKGDERYMMISTYYRQQGYKTYYSLKSSLSLILQIPFFIAAYNYLSNLEVLKNMGFWIFTNLGEPDRLLNFGSFSINVLPIIMTIINVVAAYIYLKGATRSQKIQTYGIALIFLVLLYTSPAGLVIYWTFNQVFSLVKNVFTKLVTDRKILGGFVSLIGLAIFIGVLATGHADNRKKLFLIILILIVCQIPLAAALIKEKRKDRMPKEIKPIGAKVFVAINVFLTVFMGAIIPLSVLSSSPAEFVMNGNTPGQIVLNTVCVMAGIFIVWLGVYYYLGTQRMRTIFTYGLFAFAGISLVNFFFFGRDLGTISETLVFDSDVYFPIGTVLLNVAVVLAVVVICVIIMRFLKQKTLYLVVVLIVASIGLSITQANTTSAALAEANPETNKIKASDAKKSFSLSQNGKNIIIVMLDRAAAVYLPFIFEEKPELAQKFEGFTYYPNTISFGKHTNFGIPAILGGYEYTPEAMNERSDVLLKDKHNEALRVMPTLFGEKDFKVTITDPAYADYKSPSDLSIYEGMKNVNVFTTLGKFEVDDDSVENLNTSIRNGQNRNFIYYSIFKSLPVALQPALYDSGKYYSTDNNNYTTEVFMDNYAVLEALPYMTEITGDEQNTFLFFENETTHASSALEWDTYTPGSLSDIELLAREDDYEIDGRKMKMDTFYRVKHYMINVATYMKLAEWFDYMRENDVWDNTRIVVCSDHGTADSYGQFDYLSINEHVDGQAYNPLLLVKDFDSKTFETSNEFMTNADIISMVCEGVIDDPINPFTGKPINNDDKYTRDLLITTSGHYSPNRDHPNGYVFDTSDGEWWTVHDDIAIKDNWQFVAKGE